MKKTIKALVALGITAIAAFSTAASAQGAFPPPACTLCSDWVVSPDAGTTAFGQTVLTNGNALDLSYGGSQAPGIYGAGFTLQNGGNLVFDANLFTNDALPFDTFIVTMSTSGYYWNTGMGAASFTWGGTNYTDGVLESYTTAPGGSDMISLYSAGQPVYVSFALQTTNDSLYPSYGSFHLAVTPIPEPETYAMLIAGLGLMGFVARRRQRKLAA